MFFRIIKIIIVSFETLARIDAAKKYWIRIKICLRVFQGKIIENAIKVTDATYRLHILYVLHVLHVIYFMYCAHNLDLSAFSHPLSPSPLNQSIIPENLIRAPFVRTS